MDSETTISTVEYAVEARGLARYYGRVRAVEHLEFAVRPGEIFGLVGPDGAGKSTTIRMLCGALTPSKGTAIVAGYDVVRQPERVKEHIGYMSQRFNLYPDLTFQEKLDFFADLYRLPRQLKAVRLAEALGFSRLEPFRDRLAGQLSGGMKQKLALAITFLHRPGVLLLDEPTTGVDPVSRQEFWQILQQLMQEGISILYSTPYMDEAERCSTVAFISNGRIIAMGPPQEFKRNTATLMVEVEATPLRLARDLCRTLPFVEDVQTFGQQLHVAIDARMARHEEAASVVEQELRKRGLEPVTVRLIAPSLEDVFTWFKRRQERAL